MPDFKIQIDQLTDVQEPFSFEATPAWWAAREPDTEAQKGRVESPFRFVGAASRTTDQVVIAGKMNGEVGLECSRCGKRYPHRLHDSYRLVLEPVNRDDPADPEGEKSLSDNGLRLGEDLEAGWYRGPLVRLEEFFGEVIALAMPIQPLCQETCLGICAHCGAERTDESGQGCACQDERIESPFAVLAQLKSKLGSGETE
jgi:uncharacterized protein